MSVQILGADGRPLPPAAPKMKYGALSGSGRVPYDAADSFSDQMANWQPALWSPDNEINIYRDRIVSRMRDLARNDGWASGSITRVWIMRWAPVTGRYSNPITGCSGN